MPTNTVKLRAWTLTAVYVEVKVVTTAAVPAVVHDPPPGAPLSSLPPRHTKELDRPQPVPKNICVS